MGLGVIAVSSAGGVIVAQEIADRVLPVLGMSRTPESMSGFLASAGVKAGSAAGFGVLAARLSGLPLVVLAWMGVGALAGAGADFFNAVQRSGFLSEGSTGAASRRSPSPSAAKSRGPAGNPRATA